MSSLIKVTLKRGLSGRTDREIATLQGLGLRRRHQSKILKDTVPIRGMVMKMQHLIDVERFDGDDSLRESARIRNAAAANGSKS